MRSVYISLMIGLTACMVNPDTEFGEVAGREYRNLDVGVAIDVPVGWNVIPDVEALKLTDKRPLTDELRRSEWRRARSKPLMVAYRWNDQQISTEKDVVINPNLGLFVEYIPSSSNVQTVDDYAPIFKDLMTRKQLKYNLVQEAEFDLNDFHFHEFTYQAKIVTEPVNKRIWLVKYNRHIINVTITWAPDDEKTLKLLTESFLSLRFTGINER